MLQVRAYIVTQPFTQCLAQLHCSARLQYSLEVKRLDPSRKKVHFFSGLFFKKVNNCPNILTSKRDVAFVQL